MKQKLICIFLGFLLLLTGCGSSTQVNLQEPVPIPEDGMVSQSIVKQLQSENAIATFQGTSNGFPYEWTVFGSDITEAKAVNLRTEIQQTGEGIQVSFSQEESFGFPALLSVQLPDAWDTQSATAYQNAAAVYSVSLTGSKETILNLSVREALGTLVIRPDEVVEETLPQETIQLQAQETQPAETQAPKKNSYLSAVTDSSGQVYSSGDTGGRAPVEPEDQQIDTSKTYTCTFSIECSTILNNLSMLDPAKLEMVPSGGTILAKTTVTFYEGESVFDVLQRVCRDKGIHLESTWTPIYNSAYIEGIHNLYEFDCGELSGWMYRVNGTYPNYGCSRYALQQGDLVEWRYTCDLGVDIGGKNVF